MGIADRDEAVAALELESARLWIESQTYKILIAIFLVLVGSCFSDANLDKKIEANQLLIEQLKYEQCGKGDL